MQSRRGVDDDATAWRSAGSGLVTALRRRRRPWSPDPKLGGVRFSRSATGGVVRRRVAASTNPLPPANRAPVPGSHPIAAVPARHLALKVLLIQDDPDDAQVVRSLAWRAGADVIDLRTATTRTAGEVAARTGQPDLVLLDLDLPDSQGTATLSRWRRRAHERVGDPPIVVVGDEREPAVAGVRDDAGVVSVLDKPALAWLSCQGDEGTRAFLGMLRAAAIRTGRSAADADEAARVFSLAARTHG